MLATDSGNPQRIECEARYCCVLTPCGATVKQPPPAAGPSNLSLTGLPTSIFHHKNDSRILDYIIAQEDLRPPNLRPPLF